MSSSATQQVIDLVTSAQKSLEYVGGLLVAMRLCALDLHDEVIVQTIESIEDWVEAAHAEVCALNGAKQHDESCARGALAPFERSNSLLQRGDFLTEGHAGDASTGDEYGKAGSELEEAEAFRRMFDFDDDERKTG